MSEGTPPQVVDVCADDLRRGKFELNPQAETARRRKSSWGSIAAAYAVGYIAGALTQWLMHIPRASGLAAGFFRPLAASLVLAGAFQGVWYLATRRQAPEAVWWLLIGFSVKAFG